MPDKQHLSRNAAGKLSVHHTAFTRFVWCFKKVKCYVNAMYFLIWEEKMQDREEERSWSQSKSNVAAVSDRPRNSDWPSPMSQTVG